VEELPEVRVSDADRDAAAGRLRDASVEGRLTLDELAERLERAYAARTAGELEPVVADLPETRSPAPPARRRSPRRLVVSIMGGTSLRGRFRVSGRLTAISFMGGCDVDLRLAEIDGDTVTVLCLALMGGTSVIVPEGVEVDESGFALMGGRDVKVKDVPPLPGTPLVRVRAFALMGGTSVRSKPHLGRG